MRLDNTKAVKIWLLRHDMTQQQLATALDVTPRTITRLVKAPTRLQQLALMGLDTELKTQEGKK